MDVGVAGGVEAEVVGGGELEVDTVVVTMIVMGVMSNKTERTIVVDVVVSVVTEVSEVHGGIHRQMIIEIDQQ